MTNNTMVAFYATQDQAKDAIVKLDNGGFDTKFSSIVVTNHEVLKNSHKVKIGAKHSSNFTPNSSRKRCCTC
jgi:hypothetical protein